MDLLTAIFSSAIVSAIVSAWFSSHFENQKYIRDKRLTTYIDFLDHMDKILPADELAKEKIDIKNLKEKIQLKAHQFEYFLWRVKLVSGNEDVRRHSQYLFNLYEKLVTLTEKEGSGKSMGKLFDKINSTTEDLLEEMRDEIKS